MNELIPLIRTFALLSLLTMGGGMAAYPALHHEVVDVHHWLTADALVHLYSIGQMAPGPNMMMVTAIGERVAGAPGALVTIIAFLLPGLLLVFGAGRVWAKLEGWPWRDSIREGLAPVSVGLVLAGCISLARGALVNWVAGLIAVAVFVTLMRTSKINPAYLILIGALVGAVALRTV